MYSPKDYWSSLADGYESADSLGFAPILHPQAPLWFNQAIDKLQHRAVRRALAIAELAPGSKFLDVGCGTGRWIRRYEEWGFSPFGVDATVGMLRIARGRKTGAPLIAGLAYSLPFADVSFDCVSDITVVQHIPYALQSKAIQEMVRVLRPGGLLLLMELVRGEGSHIFPRQPQEWIRETESSGTALVKCFGQEYLFLDRFFVHMAQTFSRAKEITSELGDPDVSRANPQNSSVARWIYWQLRHIAVSISTWSEPIASLVFPASTASHSIFIFRKHLNCSS